MFILYKEYKEKVLLNLSIFINSNKYVYYIRFDYFSV